MREQADHEGVGTEERQPYRDTPWGVYFVLALIVIGAVWVISTGEPGDWMHYQNFGP